MVKMLTVLVSSVSNSHVFLLNNVSSFCNCKSYSYFFSKNISVHTIFSDQSFNDTITNDIVSFEQLGPDIQRKPVIYRTVSRNTYCAVGGGWGGNEGLNPLYIA